MRTLLERMRAEGELLEVEREVDPQHELAAVSQEVQRRHRRPVLFKRVAGTGFPVVSGVYGSRDRLASIVNPPGGDLRRWNDRLRPDPGLHRVTVEAAKAVEEPVECRLGDLPLITYSAEDAGPYLTSAVYMAKDPETGIPNLSFHRSQHIDDGELRARIGSRRHLMRYLREAEERGQPLHAAVLIGPPPEVFVAAAADVPYRANELAVAAKLAGGPIPVRPCRRIDLDVPAETEIVIEGRFLPGVRRPEGPFGEFLGYYSAAADSPVFEVLGVFARPGAVFHSILCGSPEETLHTELAVASSVFAHLNKTLPGVLDVVCFPSPLHAIVKIRQAYDGHARQVLLAALGCAPTWLKVCTVVDEDINIHDPADVAWAAFMRVRPDRDIVTVPEVPLFARDADRLHWGRVGIDATVPFGRGAEFRRRRIPGSEAVDLAAYIASFR